MIRLFARPRLAADEYFVRAYVYFWRARSRKEKKLTLFLSICRYVSVKLVLSSVWLMRVGTQLSLAGCFAPLLNCVLRWHACRAAGCMFNVSYLLEKDTIVLYHNTVIVQNWILFFFSCSLYPNAYVCAYKSWMRARKNARKGDQRVVPSSAPFLVPAFLGATGLASERQVRAQRQSLALKPGRVKSSGSGSGSLGASCRQKARSPQPGSPTARTLVLWLLSAGHA